MRPKNGADNYQGQGSAVLAILRIAAAVAALYYIAPHLGGTAIEAGRPLVERVKNGHVSDGVAGAAIGFCQKHADDCIKFAKSALAKDVSQDVNPPTQITMRMPLNAALRSTLPDNPPMPPSRAIELRGTSRP